MSQIRMREVSAYAYRFSCTEHRKEIGRAYLYILRNDLHREPFGFLEDVMIADAARGRGIGTILLEAVLAQARREGCYKLIATSRSDGTRDEVHAWYEWRGLRKYGYEFRIDF